jgi:cytochrome c peroxidase
VVNPIEMGTTEAHVVEQLRNIPGYVVKFKQAFPEQAEPVTFEKPGAAILPPRIKAALR